MTDIYGGLFLENLVNKDKYYDLQIRLIEKGLIQGIQLRIAHPCFTTGVDATTFYTFYELSEKCEIFIHVGAENVGVDFGECFDEENILPIRLKTGVSWCEWNQQTLTWSLLINAWLMHIRQPLVVHPGYGVDINDQNARSKIISVLKSINIPIVLENVPPIVDRRFPNTVGKTEFWDRNTFWGFGGTPDDMKLLLEETRKMCLLDFTHIIVAVNQANALDKPELAEWRDLEKTVYAYLGLPHAKICHFSGIPPKEYLVDSYDFLSIKPPQVVKEAIRRMDAVCLEIPFRPDKPIKTIREIETFRNTYLS